MQESSQSAPRETGKLITCVLPDDGTHIGRVLTEALWHEKQITRVEVISALATGDIAAAKAKRGTLSDTYQAKIVRVVVPAAEADALFEFICEKTRIGREGGGVVFQNALATSTPFALPEGVAEEET